MSEALVSVDLKNHVPNERRKCFDRVMMEERGYKPGKSSSTWTRTVEADQLGKLAVNIPGDIVDEVVAAARKCGIKHMTGDVKLDGYDVLPIFLDDRDCGE